MAKPDQSNSKSHQHDSLVVGLSFLLVSNILQRGVGFLRNFGLCQLLDESDLGLWALASSFFVIAAPFAVLGLPGTFGRFSESYKQQGHLRPFLIKTLGTSIAGVFIVMALLLCFPAWAGAIVFGGNQSFGTMFLLAVSLFAVIVFNTTTELLGGLRQNRIVSSMHTINSLMFSIVGILGVLVTRDWRILIVAFGLSAMFAMIPALLRIRKMPEFWQAANEGKPFVGMWKRIAPFALSLWCMNLMSNLFDLVDRYMLLHLSRGSELAGPIAVGQFHSGLIIPLLITNVGMMVSSMLLPYVVADWERGQTTRVHAAIRSSFMFGSLFFTALAVGALTLSPFLFQFVLHGRYADGQGILPIALVHCSWMAMVGLLQNYFWCAERGRILGMITGGALLGNLTLNCWLVPNYGVYGAMTATMLSGGSILLMYSIALRAFGIDLQSRSWLFGLLPISLLFGPVISATALGAMIIAAGRSNWLLSIEERESIDRIAIPLFAKLGLATKSLWPLSPHPSTDT